MAKGKAVAMAANGRNQICHPGALRAAQRANAPVIIEIAKSEGGRKGLLCSELLEYRDVGRCRLQRTRQSTIPVAIHADHYGIRNEKELEAAQGGDTYLL